MRRFISGLVLLAAILAVGCTVAGCGGAASSAIASFSPSRSAGGSASPSSSAQPSVTSSKASAPVTSASQPPATSRAPQATVTVRPSSSSAAGSGSGSGLIWLWVLLGVIVLVGVIVWVVRARGRRSAAVAGWRSRVIDAYAKGSSVHDAMSVAETAAAFGAYDAAARWADIQRRSDDLTQTLYALREAAPDDANRARVDGVLVSLQAVRSAMDAERAPGGAGSRQAGVARERLAFFEASLRALRTPDEQPV